MTVRANGRERHNRLERGERAQPRSRRSHPRLLPAGSGGSSEWWQRRRRFCHPTYRFQQESWSRSRARVRTAHGSATLRTRAISSFFSLGETRALPRLFSSPFARHPSRFPSIVSSIVSTIECNARSTYAPRERPVAASRWRVFFQRTVKQGRKEGRKEERKFGKFRSIPKE